MLDLLSEVMASSYQELEIECFKSRAGESNKSASERFLKTVTEAWRLQSLDLDSKAWPPGVLVFYEVMRFRDVGIIFRIDL